MVTLLVGRMLDKDVIFWMAIFWPGIWVMVSLEMFSGVDMSCMIVGMVIGILLDVTYGVIVCCGVVWITDCVIKDGFF